MHNPLEQNCLAYQPTKSLKHFHEVGFKWIWHAQVQFNADLLRHTPKYLYKKKRLDGIFNQKEDEAHIQKLWLGKRGKSSFTVFYQV